MSRITIREIANHAGTSFKTVSRVINGESGVGDELRAKVRASLAELGYRPDRAAQTLRSGRNYALCVLTALPMSESLDLEGAPEFVSSVMAGALRTCWKAGYQLIYETVPVEEDNSEIVDSRLRTLRCDGVILFPPHSDATWLLDRLEKLGIPFVRIAPGNDIHRSACIVIDDFAAGREMGQLFLARGHRRIACIAGPDQHLAASRRKGGFVSAMEDISDIELTIEQGDFWFKSGLEIGHRLLSSPRPPSAVFAANDSMALGVMAAARERKLTLPDDLSIAGFDNSPMTQFVRPALTTVSQNVIKMGELAASQLIEAVTGRASMDNRVWELAYELCIRESLAGV